MPSTMRGTATPIPILAPKAIPLDFLPEELDPDPGEVSSGEVSSGEVSPGKVSPGEPVLPGEPYPVYSGKYPPVALALLFKS